MRDLIAGVSNLLADHAFTGPLKKSEQEIPRGLKAARMEK
jgi:hypothetical protein